MAKYAYGIHNVMSEIQSDLKVQFIGWQCRIRQHVVRKKQGRPSRGMQPDLDVNGQLVERVNLQLVTTQSTEVIQEFRFMAQKTMDPQIRYENAIQYLSEFYYQIPSEFDEEMTAVFSAFGELAEQLVRVGECLLRFEQANQCYRLKCKIRDILPQENKYQVTYWHNYLFNPGMPGRVRVLGFLPNWRESSFIENSWSGQ